MRSGRNSLLLLALLVCVNVVGQRPAALEIRSYEAGRFAIEAGLHRGLAIGDNFLSDSYRLGTGLEYGVDIFFSPKWLVGVRMDHLSADLIAPEETGSIKSTIILNAAVNIAYLYEFYPGLDLGFYTGLGYARYRHTSRFNTFFRDDGLSLWLQPKIAYRYTNNIGVFAALRFRKDFLAIETAPELEDYYKGTALINLSLGLRIVPD